MRDRSKIDTSWVHWAFCCGHMSNASVIYKLIYLITLSAHVYINIKHIFYKNTQLIFILALEIFLQENLTHFYIGITNVFTRTPHF